MLYILLLLLFVIVSAVAVRNYLSGKKLIRDWLYFTKLNSKPLQHWDDFSSANPHKSDIIVSLTTIPSRISEIEPTLKSLLAQKWTPAKIHLYLPKFSQRENTVYQIPESLHSLKNLAIIEPDTDWGPATKFIPAIENLAPNQKILVVDDDNIYPDTYVQEFAEAAAAHPDVILTASGWRVPADLIDKPTTLLSNIRKTPPTPVASTRVSKLYPVDIVQGYAGFLIKPRFFDIQWLKDYSAAPTAARFVDDVWISAHALVPKFVFPMRRFCFTLFWKQKFYKATSLAKINNHGRQHNAQRNNSVMLRHFKHKWQ